MAILRRFIDGLPGTQVSAAVEVLAMSADA